MSYWMIAAIALIAGFLTGKMRRKRLARIIAWLLAAIWIFAAGPSISAAPPGLRMLGLVFLLFIGMKTVITVYRYSGRGTLSPVRWLCFALLWPGMDPKGFEPHQAQKIDWPLLRKGLGNLVSGGLALFFLVGLLHTGLMPAYWLCLFAFPAFILIFHSGMFSMEAACLSTFGIKVNRLMDAPQRSSSLGEFWGRRWNIPFIQMIRYAVFKPLLKKTNAPAAFLSSFLVSGILHEVALSLPVNGGYGLPTLYFLIQALLILIERKFIRRIPFLLQKIWLFGCLILPFPLLFHPEFLQGVFLPVLHKLGYWISLAL